LPVSKSATIYAVMCFDKAFVWPQRSPKHVRRRQDSTKQRICEQYHRSKIDDNHKYDNSTNHG